MRRVLPRGGGGRYLHRSVLKGYFDGGCGPDNPGGTATAGALVRGGNETIWRRSGVVGEGPAMSNNVAEYAALIWMLGWVLDDRSRQVMIHSDSKLVVNQMIGQWRMKKGLYLEYAKKAARMFKLAQDRGQAEIKWVPRHKNDRADALTRIPPARVAEWRAAQVG